MKQTKEYIQMLRKFKAAHSDYYGIMEIGLFGSVARGEQKEGSDVDVFVTMKHPNLLLLVGIKQELEKLFGCSVDVIRKHSHLSPVFFNNIERDGIYA